MSTRRLTLFAGAIVVLNLLDAVFTLLYTNTGLATEGNPMMQGPLAASPVLFMMAKLSLVSLCVFLLWRLGQRRSAMIGLAGTAAMYVLLLGYHLTAVPKLVATL